VVITFVAFRRKFVNVVLYTFGDFAMLIHVLGDIGESHFDPTAIESALEYMQI
jgi:hypothetical protein